MPEQKPAALDRPQWRIRADELHDRLRRMPRGDVMVSSLAEWFHVLRCSPFETLNAEERLQAAFSSEVYHPVAWCASASAYLSPEVEVDLSGLRGPGASVGALVPFIRYIFGRAGMRSVVADPAGSGGLSLAYDLLWPLSQGGMAAAGADDELLEQLGSSDAARREIEAEAMRLKNNPAGAARGFDSDRTAQTINQAATPISLAACAHWRMRNLVIDLPYARVVQVIGTVQPEVAVNLLDSIGNTALVAAFLSESDLLNIAILSGLLRYAETVFEATHNWNGKIAAWMILLDIEDRLLAPLREQLRRSRTGEPLSPDTGQNLRAQIDTVIKVLLNRPDGDRLAVEWLGHQLWSLIVRSPPLAEPGVAVRPEADPPQALLNELGSRLMGERVSVPARIWELFGGSCPVGLAEIAVSPTRNHSLHLPSWSDWRGDQNILVPISAAVLLWQERSDPQDLVRWVRCLCRDLETRNDEYQLSEGALYEASRYLAWPLIHAESPVKEFNEIWSNADWQFTRARFSKLEDAASVVRPCLTILNVGLRMLEWSLHAKANDPGELAWAVVDAVDSARYMLPEIGLTRWSSLVGKLSCAMAATGLLNDGGCERLLARYDGDDDSLAAAAVNVYANGVEAAEIRRVLASFGDDADSLAKRWERWNAHLARDSSGNQSVFLSRLRDIALSGGQV